MYKEKEKQKKFQREYRRKFYKERKEKVIEMLGGICKICGNDDIRVLEIDHIEPELREWKKRLNLHYQIIKGDVSVIDVQLLCANCHRIKTYEIDRFKYKNYVHEE